MAYLNEPQESCPYLDRAIAEFEDAADDIIYRFREAISKASEEIDEVRNINETLRLQNQEFANKIAELEDQIRDLENRLDDA